MKERGQGTGDNKFISCFVRFFWVSGMGRNTLFWASFDFFVGFWEQFDVFNSYGTGHNNGLEILR